MSGNNSDRISSLEPVYTAGSTVLILGSMPGAESLRKQQYYAHPRNAFWKIMGDVCGFDAEQPYRMKIQSLKDAGISVWDVFKECERIGSLDSQIRSAEPNDIIGLSKRFKKLKGIILNGRTAFKGFERNLSGYLNIPYNCAPSTSPANAAMTYPEKLRQWKKALNSFS